MGRNLIETVMGGVVLLIAGFFVVFAYNSSGLRPVTGYVVTAQFNSIGGLEVGSDVRLAGVKVGSVVETALNPRDYRAIVSLSILSSVALPTDTAASITGDSLLGGKYVQLKAGRAQETIEPGGEITRTEDVLEVEELLSRAIHLLSEEVTGSGQ